MQETRREFIDRFLRFVGEFSDTAARQVAEELLNVVLFDLWLLRPWREYVLPQDFTFATVNGTKDYALPTYFGRFGSRDGKMRCTTPGFVDDLIPADRNQILERVPEWGTASDIPGPPSNYVIGGKLGVIRQPAAAGVALEAVSSDAGDVDVHVVIEGNDATGNYTSSDVLLTGTNAVAVGTWTPPLVMFAKAWPQTIAPPTALTSSRGTVTLRSAVDHVTVYQSLLPQESAREQLQLSLFPTPNGIYSYAAPVIRKPRRFIHDTDPIPELWMPALWEGMEYEWRVNTGELNRAQIGKAPRPMRDTLIAYDNEAHAGNQRYIRPFGMGRRW